MMRLMPVSVPVMRMECMSHAKNLSPPSLVTASSYLASSIGTHLDRLRATFCYQLLSSTSGVGRVLGRMASTLDRVGQTP